MQLLPDPANIVRMEYIRITKENLDKEHICCAISDNKDIQVANKKAWLAERFDDGLVFLRSVERGKCFIEYIPAENVWCPVDADGYMHINCFWVSGAFKGHGYSNDLLSACIDDAKAAGKLGLTVVSSPKKTAFLSDPKHLAHKGFRLADSAAPFFSLLYLPFTDGAPVPKFKDCAKRPRIDKRGFVVYYTHSCPFTAKYVPLVESYAKSADLPFESILIDSKAAARSAPVAWTNYALFYDGEFVTNEIQNEKRFAALVGKLVGR